ncbi:serine hydrolase domain-containing protein [Agaribacter flavus]|uniref:Serine hydrolase domain-containing protein n=1 Tax=Agaribacter flavus TaxID=1902781 RepID=A0ABV7FUV3_9ALTE
MKHLKILAFSLSALLATYIGLGSAYAKVGDPAVDLLANKIDRILKSDSPRKFNGVISIEKDGKNIYAKAQGYADFDKQERLKLHDNFRIQSNSKQITGVLILKEVEKGSIDLARPVSEYLPTLQVDWAKLVTVHQLVNMSAGIVALDKPLLFQPGTGFHYSNPAYALLGRIIEQVSGKKYSEVANAFFKEIGMHNTFCYDYDENEQALVNGYQWAQDKYQLVNFNKLGFTPATWEDFIPTGGIISNVQDLHIWDTKLHNGELLSRHSYEIMTTSNVPDTFTPLSEDEIAYGYGINIINAPISFLGHGGSGFGFASIKFYIPEKKINVIVLENLFHDEIPIRYFYQTEIRKLVLGSDLVR